ncbi:MAG: hypothetical protein ACT4NU_13900 [Chromatiales bacterium]
MAMMDMQEQMRKMQTRMDQARRAKTPEEGREALRGRMQAMQDMMKTMRGMQMVTEMSGAKQRDDSGYRGKGMMGGGMMPQHDGEAPRHNDRHSICRLIESIDAALEKTHEQ